MNNKKGNSGTSIGKTPIAAWNKRQMVNLIDSEDLSGVYKETFIFETSPY